MAEGHPVNEMAAVAPTSAKQAPGDHMHIRTSLLSSASPVVPLTSSMMSMREAAKETGLFCII